MKIVYTMVLLVGLVMVGGSQCASAGSQPPAGDAGVMPAVSEPAVAKKPLPRLLDLGATKCKACKMMESVLAELKAAYAGKMDVEFIDVWQNPEAGKKYGIETIPTQIFFDAEGKERFRHTGFISKEDILAKWAELGVSLK